MRVSVAIDLALDRLFTYEVPEALQKKLAVGQLLSVPFGHREARGFAIRVDGADRGDSVDRVARAARVASVASVASVGRSETLLTLSDSKRPYALKPVTAIVDETPFFSPALLELVKKVADYTASPIEAVLKTALPAAVLKKNARPRELMFIEPALAPAAVPMTPRLQWVYDQIVRLGGGWMQQLCRELKTTPGTIRHLGANGAAAALSQQRPGNQGQKQMGHQEPLEIQYQRGL